MWFRMSLRSHLLALVLAALVPVLVFSGVLVFVLARHEQGSVERGSRGTARALSAVAGRIADAIGAVPAA